MATANVDPAQVTVVAERCVALFGKPSRLSEPPRYPDSLALCILDSIQTPGVKHVSVERVLRRYRTYRAESGANADKDGADNLLDTFHELGGVDAWIKRIGTYNRTPPRPGAPYKAEIIRAAARMFSDAEIKSTARLRQIAKSRDALALARAQWVSVVGGEKTGVTWHYLLMLAGIPGVKPDRMIARFVAGALGVPSASVSSETAARILAQATKSLGVSSTTLDYHVWLWQRRREHTPRRRL
jgi:hypothetical protein